MARCYFCQGAIIPDYDSQTGEYTGKKCLMCSRTTDYEYEFSVSVIQAITPREDKEYGAANSKYYGKHRRGARGHTFKDD